MNMRSQVIVLGMHRSGTSLIASILHLSGISMGKEFLRPDNGNPGGYFEDLEFLNQSLTSFKNTRHNVIKTIDVESLAP